MADILIKGIDMNTAREKRFLNVHVFIAEGDTMEASAIDIFGKVIGFYDVVEVKPHGRLIDADLWLSTHWVSQQVIDAIKNAPTVLEAVDGENC